MEFQLRYMTSNVFIFDIDGCIMPNVFSLKEKTSVHALSLLSLYPEFVEFYKNYCSKSLAVHFITGRKQRDYGMLTEKQLRPLKRYKEFRIKYYPEDKPHELEDYFIWKTTSIKEIMNQWNNEIARFHIYDDLEGLFPIIFQEISSKIHIYKLNLIQAEVDWASKPNIYKIEMT